MKLIKLIQTEPTKKYSRFSEFIKKVFFQKYSIHQINNIQDWIRMRKNGFALKHHSSHAQIREQTIEDLEEFIQLLSQKQLKFLKRLSIRNCTFKPFKALKRLKHIEHLTISATKLEGIIECLYTHINQLRNIKHLSLELDQVEFANYLYEEEFKLFAVRLSRLSSLTYLNLDLDLAYGKRKFEKNFTLLFKSISRLGLTTCKIQLEGRLIHNYNNDYKNIMSQMRAYNQPSSQYGIYEGNDIQEETQVGYYYEGPDDLITTRKYFKALSNALRRQVNLETLVLEFGGLLIEDKLLYDLTKDSFRHFPQLRQLRVELTYNEKVTNIVEATMFNQIAKNKNNKLESLEVNIARNGGIWCKPKLSQKASLTVPYCLRKFRQLKELFLHIFDSQNGNLKYLSEISKAIQCLQLLRNLGIRALKLTNITIDKWMKFVRMVASLPKLKRICILKRATQDSEDDYYAEELVSFIMGNENIVYFEFGEDFQSDAIDKFKELVGIIGNRGKTIKINKQIIKDDSKVSKFFKNCSSSPNEVQYKLVNKVLQEQKQCNQIISEQNEEQFLSTRSCTDIGGENSNKTAELQSENSKGVIQEEQQSVPKILDMFEEQQDEGDAAIHADQGRPEQLSLEESMDLRFTDCK